MQLAFFGNVGNGTIFLAERIADYVPVQLVRLADIVIQDLLVLPVIGGQAKIMPALIDAYYAQGIATFGKTYWIDRAVQTITEPANFIIADLARIQDAAVLITAFPDIRFVQIGNNLEHYDLKAIRRLYKARLIELPAMYITGNAETIMEALCN